MRTELARAVRDRFDALVRQRLPQFQPHKGQKIGPRCYSYSWVVAPDLTFFLMLQVSTKLAEEFTIEVAFSRDGMFPEDLFPGPPLDADEMYDPGVPSAEAWRLRLSHLFRRDDPFLDYRWLVTPSPDHHQLTKALRDLADGRPADEVPLDTALANVVPLVEDAINRFVVYGMPFLREVAQARGIKLPSDTRTPFLNG